MANKGSNFFDKSEKGQAQENVKLDEEAMLPSPDDPQILQEEIETLKKALEEAQEKADAHWERLLRKEAELKNIQHRSQQDLENSRKFAIERFASELIPVLDSFDQGINFSQNGQGSVADLLKGMELTHSVLINVLEKHGITLIDPQGDVFNPTYHEVISMQETSEIEPNRIALVVQKGYMLNNRLLRPARVVVAKAPA